MRLRHKGIRPTYEIQLSDFKRKIYYEEYPDESIVWWNTKMLNSGCGGITYDPIELMGCLYCPWCEEYFNKKQWETVSE